MAFPNGTRIRTYAPGDPIRSDDMNQMQDADIAAYAEIFTKRTQVLDSFTGQSVNTGIWKTPVGTVTIIDDSANGGNGAVKIDATAGGTHNIETQPFALAGDFTLRGRLRVTGVTAASVITLGMRVASDTAFLLEGSTSTVVWRALASGASVPANGTPAAVSAVFAEFELKRTGTLITMTVNGVLHHSLTSGVLTGSTLKAQAAGAGILFVDRIEFLA